jgi:hypothetical protein
MNLSHSSAVYGKVGTSEVRVSGADPSFPCSNMVIFSQLTRSGIQKNDL